MQDGDSDAKFEFKDPSDLLQPKSSSLSLTKCENLAHEDNTKTFESVLTDAFTPTLPKMTNTTKYNSQKGARLIGKRSIPDSEKDSLREESPTSLKKEIINS
mmetsp:Transcript_17770/g.30090  ORF Transcript_17770/g.30090 Transcript_17770/m.30090 type:complete len:102 (+) Transcript_17770:504-809(+)